VERANKTLQDRLVKELRLQGVDTLAAGNAMLPAFMADYNARFAKEPADAKDLRRPLAPGEDLDEVFAWREERTVSNSLTLQCDKVLFLLEPTPVAKGLKRKKVTVADYPDGRLKISHGGVDLPYRVFFDKISQVPQGDIVENKRLGAVLAHIRAEQRKTDAQRSAKAPKRRSQAGDLFKVG
jgi:hypothetical protein